MCVGRKSEGSLMLMMLMKRYNNLIEKIATKENIELADKKQEKVNQILTELETMIRIKIGKILYQS